MPRRVLQAPIPPQQGFKPELKLIWTPEFPLGTGGLVTSLPAVQLNPDQASELENWDIWNEMLTPRYGYNMSEVAPDADLNHYCRSVAEFELLDGTEYYAYALTRYDLWTYDPLGPYEWTKRTRAGGASFGPSTWNPESAMIQDVLVITRSNGVPQQFTDTGTDIADLSADITAGIRYVASFADRAIFAGGTATAVKQKVQWSVSGDITDYTGTGSGSLELVDNPKDPIDEILGLTVHGDLLVIYRRNSIWVGQRTGVPTPALAFQARVQGLGAVAPHAVQKIGPEGDIFVTTDNVYFYSPGDRQPIPIGDAIKSTLIEKFGHSEDDFTENSFWTAYQPTPVREFWLYIGGSEILILDLEKFFDPQNPKLVWRKYDLAHNVYGVGYSRYSGTWGARRYCMFIGSGTTNNTHVYLLINRTFGFGGGLTSQEKFTDGGAVGGDPAGTAITCTYISPEFHLPDTYIQLAKLAITYLHDSTDAVNFPITISTSIDGGETWDNARTYNLRPCDEDRTVEFGIREAYGDSVMFKIECQAYDYSGVSNYRPQINLINYKLGLIPRGEKRTRNLMVHKDLKLQWDILST